MHRSLPAFIDTIPDYEVREGQMHISMGALVLVMPVHIFLDGVARAEGAIAKWHLRELEQRDNNVIPIMRPA